MCGDNNLVVCIGVGFDGLGGGGFCYLGVFLIIVLINWLGLIIFWLID